MTTSAPSKETVSRESIRPIAQAFGLLAAALLVLSIFYGLYTWQTIVRERQTELEGLAHAMSRAAFHLLQDHDSVFPVLVDEIAEAGGVAQPAAAEKVLRRFLRTAPGFERLDLHAADGAVLVSTGPAASTARPPAARERAVLAVLSLARTHDGPQVGPHSWRDADGHEWLPIAMRVLEAATGHTNYILVAQVRLDEASLWFEIRLPAQTAAAMVADRGDILVARGDAIAEGREGPVWKAIRALGFPSSGIVTTGSLLDGSARTQAFHRVDGRPVAVFAGIPHSALWAAWFERVRIPLLVFALAFAGMSFAAAWSHRQQRQRETEMDVATATLREQESELRRQSGLLSQTQRAAHVGGWEVDIPSGRLYWTEETYRIHEVVPGEYQPTVEAALDFYDDTSRRLVRDALEKSMRSGQSWDLELQLVTAKGRNVWVRATGVVEPGPTGTPVKLYGAVQDVTERHRADERIRRLAHYDDLTALPNRNLFTYHLGHALSRAERYGKQLAVLFIDLDRFKIINDTLGHDTGDRVLETIGRRLAEQMRAADLVARLGGDEFMVIVEEVDSAEVVEDVARKLLLAIEQPVQHQDQEFSLSASIGISIYPQDGRDQQSLLKHADIAMYRAKEKGKNCFELYSSGMNSANMDRLSLESRLKRAVTEQNQFVLHYQPKVSVADGRVVGVEALVRWMSPDRGLVPPVEFIPLAEETGLIGAIGEWVFATACEQAAAWARKGLPPVRVAVNLSARQLYSPGFLDTVRRILLESGVQAGAMEMEITESVMMQDVEQVAAVLGELQTLGVHVAVDDFGPGYSSLAYLKRLPLDSLKVDRSFIRDVPGDPDDESITRAVVALAHSLRLKVVAEGVETDAQLGFLRELGCDEIQGFLFSRPIPAADFEELLRRDLRFPTGGARDAA
jgi:diguanylate cyclase (GGDEF)-like protein